MTESQEPDIEVEFYVLENKLEALESKLITVLDCEEQYQRVKRTISWTIKSFDTIRYIILPQEAINET